MIGRAGLGVAVAAFATMLLTSAACGPGGFDGLVGGTKDAGAPDAAGVDDPTVVAPRSLSPLSVSWVTSPRPRFQWVLAPGTTGALLELCPTRACAPQEIKRFETDGPELVLPEDLPAGVWFWRLRGRAPGHTGTVAGPTWEFVQRGVGTASKGTGSNAPTGAMVDVNGDGQPDLLTGGDDSRLGPSLMIYLAAGEKFSENPTEQVPFAFDDKKTPPNLTLSIGGGTDTDGDGFSDVIHSGFFPSLDGLPPPVGVEFGSPGGLDGERYSDIFLPFRTLVVPLIGEGGDLNGDGYGDVLVSTVDVGFAAFGYADGPGYGGSTLNFTDRSGMGKSSYAVHGGFDADGDGIGDLAFSFDEPRIQGVVTAGQRTGRLVRYGDLTMIPPSGVGDPGPATAITSGDFNGDSLGDLALTAPLGQGSIVCLWFGDPKRLAIAGPCVASDKTETEFGANLTAADLDADGKDELLLSTKSGGALHVKSLSVNDKGNPAVSDVGPPGFGARLTTLWPGRPDVARWAATAENGQSIGVFKGTKLVQSLNVPRDITGYGRVLR